MARPPRTRSTTLPAPVEGWDTETPVGELPQTRARLLDNWVPAGVSVAMRRGCAAYATGMPAAVETLMPYSAGATSSLFAAAGSAIYNATGAGAVGAAVQSGLTSARWSFVNFSTPGGNFLWCCNGADAPRHWNGSAWTQPTLTGVTATDILAVFESKQRLFFILKNSLSFGYLAVETIAGAVSTFNLGSVFSRGGRLVAGATFTQDGGSGPEDYTVFVTSVGEVAIYRGSNPASSSDWGLVGSWFVGEPIGDRPIVELDGDVGLITRAGVQQIGAELIANEALQPDSSLTSRIGSAFRAHVAAVGSASGWQGLYYPSSDWLVIAAPSGIQYVRHASTGGWSRFTGWPATCFGLFAARLCFGTADGRVMLADVGFLDDGADVIGQIETAWTALDGRGTFKTAKMARAVVTTETSAAIGMVVRVDYRRAPAVPAPPVYEVANVFVLNSATFGILGTNVIGGEDLATRAWRSVSGGGHAFSIAMSCLSRQSAIALNGIDLIYEAGGPV